MQEDPYRISVYQPGNHVNEGTSYNPLARGTVAFHVFRNLPDFISKGENPTNLENGPNTRRYRVGDAELTVATDPADLLEMAKAVEPPFHSLLVYSSYGMLQRANKGLKTSGIASQIRTIDSLLPQFLFADNISVPVMSSFARVGIKATVDEHTIGLEMRRILMDSASLPNATLIKMGGSATDFDRENPCARDLEYRCEDILWSRNEINRTKFKKTPRKRVVVTAGAGQYGDYEKFKFAKYGDVQRVKQNFPRNMAQGLYRNIETFHAFFGDNSSLIKPGAEYYLTPSYTSGKVVLCAMPPHHVLARQRIPLQDSDTATLALAEWVEAPTVILIKRADGIYERNPYFGHKKIDGEPVWDKWEQAQSGNPLLASVSVEDMLSGPITRTGQDLDGQPDGSGGHLMEDSALRYFADHCRHVQKILVVHVAPWEMWRPMGDDSFRHVSTKEEMKLGPGGWREYARNTVHQALKYDVARSMIVR